MDDIIVRIIDAPPAFKGCVKKDSNGDLNVYINGRLSEWEKRKAYEHEMRHIEYGHLYNDMLTVEEKEKEAENEKPPYVREGAVSQNRFNRVNDQSCLIVTKGE